MRTRIRSSVVALFVLVLVVSTVSVAVSAQAAPQYESFNADPSANESSTADEESDGSWGTYRATDGLTGVTTADGPEPYGDVKWSDSFTGEPTGAPTVVGDTAYLPVAVELEYYKKIGGVVAYDTETGDVRWQRTGLGIPRGSPTVVGDTVYTATNAADPEQDWAQGSDGAGGMYALDAESGETQWVRNETEFWPESAVHTNGTVYTVRRPETPDAGNVSIVALDDETGETEWSVDGRRLFGAANGTLYVARDGDMLGIDTSTGERLWSVDAPTTGEHGNYGVVSVTDRAIFAVNDNADDELRVSAYSTADGSTLWNTTVTNDANGQYRPAVADGAVFVTADHDELVRLDAATGAEAWRYEAKEGALSGAPTVANDTVYVGSHTLKETEENEEGYRGRKHAVIAVDAVNGSQQWGYVTDSGDYGDADRVLAPSVVDDSLYLPSHTDDMYPQESTGHVYAFAATTAEPPVDTIPSDGFHEAEEARLDAHISVTEDDPDQEFGNAKHVTLEASASSVRSGNVTTYEWDVDNDGTFDASGEGIEVAVEQCKSLTVTLRVTTDEGETDTESVILRNG